MAGDLYVTGYGCDGHHLLDPTRDDAKCARCSAKRIMAHKIHNTRERLAATDGDRCPMCGSTNPHVHIFEWIGDTDEG